MDISVCMVGRAKMIMPSTFNLRDGTMNFATLTMFVIVYINEKV